MLLTNFKNFPNKIQGLSRTWAPFEGFPGFENETKQIPGLAMGFLQGLTETQRVKTG